MAAILKVTLAVDLDVLPGELLADPVKAGIGDHLHGQLPLLRLDLLLQKGVHAERDWSPALATGTRSARLWPAAGDIAQPLQAAPHLAGQGFFAGHVEEKLRPERVSQHQTPGHDHKGQDQAQATAEPPGP